jgi:hypothetical protein
MAFTRGVLLGADRFRHSRRVVGKKQTNNRKVNSMRNSILVRGLGVLAVCALALATPGSAKNPVSRPYMVHGNLTFTQYVDGTWEFQACGEGTHLGQFTTVMSWKDVDQQGMHLTCTTANGDKIFSVIPFNPGAWHLEITGGTGRFEYATGGQNATYESQHVRTYNPAPGIDYIETWAQKAEGLITY